MWLELLTVPTWPQLFALDQKQQMKQSFFFFTSDAQDVDVLVKNVEALRHKLVTDFVRNEIRRAGKCAHCQARIRPVKQEHHARVVLMGKLKDDTYETPR